jgi:hypothetical protein
MSLESRDLSPLVEQYIMPGFKASVEKEVDRIVRAAAEEAKKRVLEKIPELVGGIVVKLSTRISVERFGQEIRIVLQLPEEKN